MSEEKFDFQQFAYALNDRLTEFAKDNNFQEYKDDESWTNRILDKIIPDILNEQSSFVNFVKYSKEHRQDIEYYQKEIRTIDFLTWTSFSPSMPNEQQKHLWRYNILVESENNGKTWLHEMQKLATTIAPYKLIITYGRTKNRTNDKKATPSNKGVHLLELAQDILEGIDNKNPEEFIIMFGEELGNIKDSKSISNLYDIYYYNNRKPTTNGKTFIQIPPKEEFE